MSKIRVWYSAEAEVPFTVDASEMSLTEIAALIESVVPEPYDAEVEDTA